MATPHIDETQLQALVAEGLSPTEIAKRLGIPRSTIRDRLKKLDATLPLKSPHTCPPKAYPRCTVRCLSR